MESTSRVDRWIDGSLNVGFSRPETAKGERFEEPRERKRDKLRERKRIKESRESTVGELMH